MRVLRSLTMLSAFTVLGAVALIPPTPGAAQSQYDADLPPQAWLSVTERTERGHRNGNPNAEGHLIEFISYTCSHCADFARQADGTLDVAAVGPGYISVEVRPVIRNSIDLVVSLLAQCGDPNRFKERHRALLYSQGVWLTKAMNAPQGQKQIWERRTAESRVNAAIALGLDDTMRDFGISRPTMIGCLRDEATAQKILANDAADREEFTITGTPTFALNGEKLDEAGDWPTLARTLQERFRPKAQGQVIENGRVTTVDR